MLQSLRKLRIPSWTYRPVANLRWFSDDEKFDKKDKEKLEKEKPKRVIKNKEASDKLKSLLENMSNTPKADIKIQTAPKKKQQPAPKVVEETPAEKHVASVKKITESIAKKIGGDVKQTESELLAQLLGIKDLKHPGSLSDLISAMKVDESDKQKPVKSREPRRSDNEAYPRRNERDSYSRADNVRRSLMPSRDRNFQRRSEPAPQSGVVNLFGAEPLGIFTKASTAKDPLETWSKLEQRELKLAVTHPPDNYFEKMIMWTDQGKLWKFPIDNEDGWDEEKATDFSEHILLEMHLEGWCPTSGPVRHFMELVCVGLSKNHFLSAKEKKDHIMWYREYFEEKKDLLGDLMALGKAQQPKLEAN